MAIPDYQSVMLPLLKLIDDEKEHSIQKVTSSLMEFFKLTNEEKTKLLVSGHLIFGNRVGWACTYLRKAGLLRSTKRAHFIITQRGLEVLKQNPIKIDVKFLEQYPQFLKFKKASPKVKKREVFSLPTKQISAKRDLILLISRKDIWDEMMDITGMDKREFGKKISFVEDKFKRDIIFRDVEDACRLLKADLCKPATILAGSIVEELLRLYLTHKKVQEVSRVDKFEAYIGLCVHHRLLKDAVSKLSGAIRGFRNLVHLKNESEKKHTILKPTATTAIASIFTIVNDF